MDWCKAEPLGVIIVPPFTNAPGNRSKKNLLMVLDQFPLTAERYRARDVTGDGVSETFCNFFTRDFCRAMGVPLPEGLRANDYFTKLHEGMGSWRFLTKLEAGLALELGKPVFAIAKNDGGPGHMTPCREMVVDTIYVDHVGRHNARRLPISAAFGHLAPGVEFWGNN